MRLRSGKAVYSVFLARQEFRKDARRVLIHVRLEVFDARDFLGAAATIADVGLREYGEGAVANLQELVCGKDFGNFDGAAQGLVCFGLGKANLGGFHVGCDYLAADFVFVLLQDFDDGIHGRVNRINRVVRDHLLDGGNEVRRRDEGEAVHVVLEYEFPVVVYGTGSDQVEMR